MLAVRMVIVGLIPAHSDWKDSAFLGTIQERGSIELPYSLYVRAISFCPTSSARRGSIHIPRSVCQHRSKYYDRNSRGSDDLYSDKKCSASPSYS